MHKESEPDVVVAQAVQEVIETSPPAPGVEGSETLVELVLAEHEARAAEAQPLPPQLDDGAPGRDERALRSKPRIDGVVIGRLVGWDASGEPLVMFAGAGHHEPLPARAMTALDEAHVGRDVALLFEGGDPTRPVVMGLMFQRPDSARREPLMQPSPPVATADGERLVFSAEKEIVLQCGQASITLTRAGKILIRGAYVLSRSSGVNRIQGGSVQIN